MPANFLIVCGGSGRGILHRFQELGFEGALQIDVKNQLIGGNDGQILKFPLPLPPNVENTPSSVSSLGMYMADLKSQWEEGHISRNHVGSYDSCLDQACLNYKRRVNHVDLALSATTPSSIINGMSQSPIIGRSYITRTNVSQGLRNQLSLLLGKKPANENVVTVWLVASTAGGTGNGIVHHVADLVKETFAGLNLKIKFIRVGGLTYRSINRLSSVSTFWSVLTDYSYMNAHKQKTVSLALRGESYPIVQEFYYIDLPDVQGDTQKREQLVQSAFVAFANPTLDAKFVDRLNNFGGVVFARVGEWGKTFDRDAVYRLTLRQLKQKIEALLQPRDAAMLAEVQSFTVKEVSTLNTEEVRTRCANVASDTSNAEFLTNIATIGTEFNTINNVNVLQSHPRWQAMRDVVAKIFDEQEGRTIRREVQISMVINNETININLGGNQGNVNDRYVASVDHIQRIRIAQRTKAKVMQHLFGNADTKGLISTVLRDTWNGLIPEKKVKTGLGFFDDLFTENKDRQNKFSGGILSFLQEYFKVTRCIEVLEEAESIIEDAKQRLKNVVIVVDREIQNTAANIPHEYTNSAELDDTFGSNETWLRLLVAATMGDVNILDGNAFRKIVEQGASGLTTEGLKYVIDVHPASSNEQIVHAINKDAGVNDSVWWQGIAQPLLWGTEELNYFDYRVFPKLPDGLRTALLIENDNWGPTHNQSSPEYLDLNSPALGLKVYAVQCVGPAINTDEPAQIKQLITLALNSLKKSTVNYFVNGKFDPQQFRTIQCQRSQGLPVRVPHGLYLIEPDLRLILDEVSDCFVIDDSKSLATQGGAPVAMNTTPEVQ